MKNTLILVSLTFSCLGILSCNSPGQVERIPAKVKVNPNVSRRLVASDNLRAGSKNKDILGVVPNGYVLVSCVKRDLNNDGVEDLVMLIKGTDSTRSIKDESRGILDRNRRGLVVLYNQGDQYILIAEECREWGIGHGAGVEELVSVEIDGLDFKKNWIISGRGQRYT